MSDETRKDGGQPNAAATADATTPDGAPLSGLMADGDAPAADLQGKAAAAAQAAGGAVRVPIRPRPSARSRGLDTGLKVALVVNLVLIFAIALMPNHDPSGPEAETPAEPTETESENDGRFEPQLNHAPVRRSERWLQALAAGDAHDYRSAIQLLEESLVVERNMPEVMRRLTYSQLSYYATREGNMALADEYLAKANQILRRSYLPDDLLRSARNAEVAGDATRMRAAYARFLLQQGMVPASARQSIHEAYLKLGDSYRMQAERFRDPSQSLHSGTPSAAEDTPSIPTHGNHGTPTPEGRGSESSGAASPGANGHRPASHPPASGTAEPHGAEAGRPRGAAVPTTPRGAGGH